MAKKKGKFSKKIMPPKEVTVKSRAYGIHTRVARGSKTPVAINDAFKEHVAKTVVINSVAKRVHDLLKRCGESFKYKTAKLTLVINSNCFLIRNNYIC